MTFDTQKVYTSNNDGEYTVVEYHNCAKVEIQFTATNYTTFAEVGAIKKGNVKDRLKPSVAGVGFIGDGKHQAKNKGTKNKAYAVWYSMILRCYCPKTQALNPSYTGCSVAPVWHNFQNFADWYELNHVEGLQLDKDIKVKGNKVYSPDTCTFTTHNKNAVHAHARNYRLLSPTGVAVDIYNMAQFARDNNLGQAGLSKVVRGKIKQHKGWKLL